MDDVLPKPFTKKSLLDMLEKHLVHLKTLPPGMDPASTVPMAAQTSASHSVKEDSSPGQSPATSMTTWQSPSQLQGVSPIHPNIQQVPSQYVQQLTPTGTAFAIDKNGIQFPTTQAPLNAATVRPQHRRQISEMSSAPDGTGFAKRQRMYAQPTPPMVNHVHGGQPG
jgi:osomolarity two-component system response regulator SKN7